jgi:hypothetical protein
MCDECCDEKYNRPEYNGYNNGGQQYARQGYNQNNYGGNYVQMTDSNAPQTQAMQRQNSNRGEEELPAPWVKTHDPKTGRYYYYNQQTAESAWEKPAEILQFQQRRQQERQNQAAPTMPQQYQQPQNPTRAVQQVQSQHQQPARAVAVAAPAPAAVAAAKPLPQMQVRVPAGVQSGGSIQVNFFFPCGFCIHVLSPR